MPAPPPPANEAARYSALLGYHLHQSVLGDAASDAIVHEAIRAFDVPQAAIALVGQTTVYFVAESGVGFHKLPREISFCGYAIHSRVPLIVTDASGDRRFSDNPLVVGYPFVRFYAGAPLIDKDGYSLGTFCLVDTRPRLFSPFEADRLVQMSQRAMRRIDLLTVVSEMTHLPGDQELV